MRSTRVLALLILAVAASFVPACALLQKGDQGAARYFSPEREPDPASPAPAGAPEVRTSGASEAPREVRLGRVTGAPHLEERLVYRPSAHEIGYYRELRWTEPPEAALARLLARALFEEHGLRHVVGGAGPAIDVQLTSLDEILAPVHLARAQVVATLQDEHLVLWQETLTVDLPIAGARDGDPTLATVEALGEALQTAARRVADRVARELEVHP